MLEVVPEKVVDAMTQQQLINFEILKTVQHVQEHGIGLSFMKTAKFGGTSDCGV